MIGKNQTREAMGEEIELRDERKTLISRVSQADGAWLLVGTRRFEMVRSGSRSRPERGWDISGVGMCRRSFPGRSRIK